MSAGGFQPRQHQRPPPRPPRHRLYSGVHSMQQLSRHRVETMFPSPSVPTGRAQALSGPLFSAPPSSPPSPPHHPAQLGHRLPMSPREGAHTYVHRQHGRQQQQMALHPGQVVLAPQQPWQPPQTLHHPPPPPPPPFASGWPGPQHSTPRAANDVNSDMNRPSGHVELPPKPSPSAGHPAHPHFPQPPNQHQRHRQMPMQMASAIVPAENVRAHSQPQMQPFPLPLQVPSSLPNRQSQPRVLIVNQQHLTPEGGVSCVMRELEKLTPGRIRLKQGTLPPFVHFLASDPHLTTAFAIFHEDDVLIACMRQEKAASLGHLKEKFRRSFVLGLCRSQFGFRKMAEFANAYHPQLPRVILAGEAEQAARLMTTLTHNVTKETQASGEQRLQQLKQRALHRSQALAVLESIPGITPGDSGLLLDCFGSILAVMQATCDEILHMTPCSRQTAIAVQSFFESMEDVELYADPAAGAGEDQSGSREEPHTPPRPRFQRW